MEAAFTGVIHPTQMTTSLTKINLCQDINPRKEETMMRRRILLLITVFCAVLLAACAAEQPAKPENSKLNWFNSLNEGEPDSTNRQQEDDSLFKMQTGQQIGINLYFYDESDGQLSPEIQSISDEFRGSNLIQQAVKELAKGPDSNELISTLPKDLKVNRVKFAENIITVDLSSEFYQSENLPLTRASLVNTILELGNAKYVKLLVDGKDAVVSSDLQRVVPGLLTRYPVKIADIIAQETQTFDNPATAKINRELFFQDNTGRFLLPEVRTIMVKGGKYAEAIIRELTKGPEKEGMGYFPTLPKGTTLLKTETVNEDENTGIALYFSKEFSGQFADDSEQENLTISSILYSISTLPGIDFVNIHYDDGHGQFISKPSTINKYQSSLQNMTIEYEPDKFGKRIRVYFCDEQGMLLVPEYRAISQNEKNVLSRIMTELSTEPLSPGSVRVIPSEVSQEDIRIKTLDNMAVVDIPFHYFNSMEKDNKRLIQSLYAVVNTLTVPINSCGISEVQFTVGGNLVDSHMDISLKEPFMMNPALIKEEP